MRFIDPDGRSPFDIIVYGSNNSSFTIKTSLVKSSISLSDYGLSHDFKGNQSISANELIPDAIGLDLGASLNAPVFSGSIGVNLIWHTRGEKSSDVAYPEIHTYSAGQVTANSEASIGANISLILAWATNADGTMASNDYVANGLNWTGTFYGASVALGEAFIAGGGSYFTARNPLTKANGQAWSGVTIGWTPQLSATGGMGKLGGTFGKMLDKMKKGTLGGALSKSYYWMNYGNGSDHLSNGEDISGWHFFNPIDAPKDDK